MASVMDRVEGLTEMAVLMLGSMNWTNLTGTVATSGTMESHMKGAGQMDCSRGKE